MLTGIKEAKVGNVVSLRELLRLSQLGNAVIAGKNNRSVEVLVPARAEMVQDAHDEDARCLFAKSVQILSVTLLEKTNGLIFDNRDHLILTVLVQEEAERSGRKQDVGQGLIVL